MEVQLKWATPDAERHVLFMARVSNPDKQDSTDTRLINYLIKNKHWSPFEMVNLCVEVKTSRAVSAQMIRHRSFSFQEFSQRYAEVSGHDTECYPARRQDEKNRQNSIDDMDEETRDWFLTAQYDMYAISNQLYKEALQRGIAKECARFLLPMSTSTTLYMNGTLRSWIHYLDLRCDPATQKEHRDVALAIRAILCEQFPVTSEAIGWRG